MVKNKTKKKTLRSPLRIYTQCLICWTWLISLSLQCEVEDVCVTECVNTDPGYYCMPCPPRYKGTQPYGLGLQAAHENKQARVSLFEYQCSPPPPHFELQSWITLCSLCSGRRCASRTIPAKTTRTPATSMLTACTWAWRLRCCSSVCAPSGSRATASCAAKTLIWMAGPTRDYPASRTRRITARKWENGREFLSDWLTVFCMDGISLNWSVIGL